MRPSWEAYAQVQQRFVGNANTTWGRRGLKEEAPERVGLLTGWEVLGGPPLHPTSLHLRTLKWRDKINTSKKALKARGEIRTGLVAAVNELRPLGLINQQPRSRHRPGAVTGQMSQLWPKKQEGCIWWMRQLCSLTASNRNRFLQI